MMYVKSIEDLKTDFNIDSESDLNNVYSQFCHIYYLYNLKLDNKLNQLNEDFLTNSFEDNLIGDIYYFEQKLLKRLKSNINNRSLLYEVE